VIEQLATATDEQLLAKVLEVQARIARAQYEQLAMLAELNARNSVAALGYRGLSSLIGTLLRCSVVEARKRAVAVERFGARRGLTGETLEPLYPATASALAVGEVGAEQAAVIADTVEAIPAVDRAQHAASVETTLLEHARTSDPHTLRQLGKRILAHLDPDGPSPEEQRLQQAHRRITLTPNDDLTLLLEGRLSPSCRAIWETILTAFADRRPDDAMGPDTRTAPQRLHDAFEEAGRRQHQDSKGRQHQASTLVRMRTARPGAAGPMTHHPPRRNVVDRRSSAAGRRRPRAAHSAR
jgi:uncharacterized protein DUF222